MSKPSLGLFEAYGVEIEFMIVDRETLAVRPIADEVLAAAAGEIVCDHESGPVGWSNELVLHLIELKMQAPSPTLAGWAERFHAAVQEIQAILAPLGAMLLPGPMHPTIDPRTETRLWPHENREVYASYHRIFDCRRHGWANLQSVHLNLPFRGDEEFGRLHAAARAVLPAIPALAAGSPVMDGRLSGHLDSRVHVYLTHQARIAAAMGDVIPEPIWTRAEYEQRVLQRMYDEIRPHDPEGILQEEFLNARGAIARFERDAIEIRLIDAQEHPRADLAICLLVSETVRALSEERFAPRAAAQALETDRLVRLLRATVDHADEAVLDDEDFLRVFGLRGTVRGAEFWRHLAAELRQPGPAWDELSADLEQLLQRGPLARRLLRALGEDPSRARIDEVWRELAACLAEGRLYEGGSPSA